MSERLRQQWHKLAGRLEGFTVAGQLAVFTAAALVIMLAGVIVLAALPGGAQQGPVSVKITSKTARAPLGIGHSVEQKFTAQQGGLSRVRTGFFRLDNEVDCDVTATLLDDRGREVAAQTHSCADIPNHETMEVLRFAPLADSKGRQYTLRLTGSQPAVANFGPLIGYPLTREPPAVFPGSETDELLNWYVRERKTTNVVLVPEYEVSSALAQVGTWVERAGMIGPWWASGPAIAVQLTAIVATLGAALYWASRHRRAAVWAVMVLSLARSLLWGGLMPPLEGMDENAHLNYTQFIAEKGRFATSADGEYRCCNPRVDKLTALSPDEVRSPADRPVWTATDLAQRRAEIEAAPAEYPGAPNVAVYTPFYYAGSALAYKFTPGDVIDKYYGVKFYTALLWVGVSLAFLFTARTLFKGRPTTAMAIALAVIMQPLISHQSGIVNSDAVVMLAASWALYFCARLITEGFAWKLFLAAAAIAVMGIMAKLSAGVVLPAVAAATVIGLLRSPPPTVGEEGVVELAALRDRAAGEARRRRAVFTTLGALGAVAALYLAWVVLENMLGWGGSLGILSDLWAPSEEGATLLEFLRLQSADNFTVAMHRWGSQMWAVFGWLDVWAPSGARLATAAFTLATGAVALLAPLALASRAARNNPAAHSSPAARAQARYWAPPAALAALTAAAALVSIPGALLIALVGSALLWLASRRPQLGGLDTDSNSILWFSSLNLAGVFVVLTLIGYVPFAKLGTDLFLQGRYGLPAVFWLLALPALIANARFAARVAGPEGGATARGMRLAPAWVTPAWAGVALASMLALHLVSVVVIVDRFYL